MTDAYLQEDSPAEPFWHRLPQVFSYPFRGQGPYVWVGVSLFLYFMSVMVRWGGLFGGMFGLVLGLGVTFSLFFNIIKHVAQGEEQMPDAGEFLHIGESMVWPALRGLSAYAIMFVPLILYIVYFKDFSGLAKNEFQSLRSFIFDPLLLIMLFLGFFYFPIATIIAAINEDIFHVLNPVIGVNMIRKAFGDYFILVIFLLCFLFVEYLLNKILLATVLRIPIPVLIPILGIFAKLYFPILNAYLMGHWVYQNNEALDYAVSNKGKFIAYGSSVVTHGGSYTRGNDPLAADLDMAGRYMEEKSFRSAKEHLEKLYAQFPQDERPLALLFEIAQSEKDAEALSRLGKERLKRLLASGEIDEAILAYGDGKIELPAELHYRLAQEFYKRGQFEGAIQAYSQLVRQHRGDPRTPKALFQIGSIYLDKLKDPKNALAIFSHLEEAHGDSPHFRDAIQEARQRAQRLQKK